MARTKKPEVPSDELKPITGPRPQPEDGSYKIGQRRSKKSNEWRPTQEELETVYTRVVEGASIKDISKEMGVSTICFFKKMNQITPHMLDEHGENLLKKAVRLAREYRHEEVLDVLYKKAMNNRDKQQVKCIELYLKHTEPENNQTVVVVQQNNHNSQDAQKQAEEVAKRLRDARPIKEVN